jgi:SAM-dependent methyltransferase
MNKLPRLSADSPRTQPNACPLCHGESKRWLGRADRELRRCVRCRFCWVPQGVKRSASGASIYDDDPSIFFADGSADYYVDETARDAAQEKLLWITRYARPPGALLDVGANVGHFSAAAAGGGFTTIGLEPNVHAVRWARERLGAPVEAGSIYVPQPEFVRRFDVITMFDVIEHLPDAAAALAHCREWLSPRGMLFLTTPDAGSAMARLLGRQWYYIDLDEHIALYSAENLRHLLERCGWRVVATRRFGRHYRFSYIERRLAYLARNAFLMRLAHVAALPLRLVPRGRVRVNLRDVIGVAAEPRR